MPLYTVSTRKSLPSDTKEKIVKAITKVHCDITEAIPEFVQVVFSEGVPLKSRVDIHLLGSIRSGRNDETKSHLSNSFKQILSQIMLSTSERVECILSDVPASWVMEGGRILPEPGDEDAWLARA